MLSSRIERYRCLQAIGALSLLLVSLVSLLPASTPQRVSRAIRLLKVQDYYGQRAFEMDGPTWFGVYPTDSGWELRKSTVSIDTVSTPRGCTPEVTRVSVDVAKEPLFLIQGVADLSEGSLDIAFFGNLFLHPGQTHSFRVQDRVYYHLRAFGSVSEERRDVVTNYALHLGHQGDWQTIARLPVAEISQPHLEWVGDVDRDGRLDFLFDLAASYVGHSYTFFLSSLATPDSLVGRAAELQVSGC